MTRILATISSVVLLSAAVSAQCFETDFGTLLGAGDDSAYPSSSTANPMNITFPMGGTFSAYTHVMANTNGCMFLWNAASGVVGGTSTGYSTAASTQLNNLRGAAGGAPRIAPLWRDLNLVAANGGGLWLNNTIPGKCVVTWANAVNFGSTSPLFTVQAQLFDTGEIKFFYSAAAQSTAACIVGVSQGGGIAAVPGVDLTGPNSSTSELMFQQFTSNTIDLQNTSVSFVSNGIGGYDEGTSACVPASNSNYGVGCYNIPGSGVYQFFADSAVASAALQGNAMLLNPSPGGYTGNWVVSGASAYIAPTGAATTLSLGDDGITTITLPSAFPGPNGSVTQLTVTSNGVVGLGNSGNNGTDFSPTGPEFAAAAGTCFYTWHDFNPVEGGAVKTEQVGNAFCISYEAIESYPNPAINPSTMQFQFDLVTGSVMMVWDSIDTDTSSTFGSAYLVGWKAAGTVADNGSQDLATALPLSTSGSTPAMSMSCSTAPVSTAVSGTLMTYQIDNIPEAVAGTGVYFGATIFSGTQDPGTDLGFIDAPGCSLYLGSLDIMVAFVGGTTSQTNDLQIPAGLPSGVQFFAQSVALIAPNSLPNGQNLLGVTTTNGVASVVSTF